MKNLIKNKIKNEMNLFEIRDKLRSKMNNNAIIYQKYYNLYYSGSESGDDVYINSIFNTINQTQALIFSMDNIILEPQLDDKINTMPNKDILIDTAELLSNMVKESLVKNSITEIDEAIRDLLIVGNGIVKIIYTPYSNPYVIRIHPNNFALAYPSFAVDSKYQIIANRTYITKAELYDKFEMADKVVNNIQKKKEQNEENSSIVITNGFIGFGDSSTSAGYIDGRKTEKYDNEPIDGLYEIIEIWQRHGENWKNTIIADDFILKETEFNFNPFIMIKYLSRKNSNYGFSFLDLLNQSQKRLQRLILNIDTATELLTRPPLIIGGYGISEQDSDEYANILRHAGSVLPISTEAGVKIEPYIPQLPIAVAFKTKEDLENDMSRIMSLTSIMQGTPAPNVRSASYARILSEFASAPIRKIAVSIEESLSYLFTQVANLYITGSVESYKIKDSEVQFNILSNIGLTIRIYAHTSSPIMISENTEMLLSLAEMDIIPKNILIDVLPSIPYRDKIKEHIAKVEQEKKEMIIQQMAQQSQQSEKPSEKPKEKKK